jgi:hypothetical protein
MRRKTWIILAAILVLGGALGGTLYWNWANSPRYALQQAALALQTRNMDDFFKYLNIKDIFNNFLEASSKDLGNPDDPEADDWTKFSRRMGGKFAQLFLPKLFDSFEGQIRSALSHYLLKLDNTQTLGVAAAVTVAQFDIQGDNAQVTMTDPKTKETLRFQMRRQPDHGVWQIVSVNYDDLKKFYKREFSLKP